MKNRFALPLAALMALSLPAWAEEVRIPAGVFTNAQSEDQYLAKDSLIGAKVRDRDGKIIGDIEDLIVNDYNQVVGVVMGTGGFVGLGEKKVGVNLSALKFTDEGGQTVISLPDATPEILTAVEPYKRGQPSKSLLERAQEKAVELKDKAATSSQDALEKAKPAFEETRQKAKEALEKAKESAGPALDAAKAAVKEGLDVAKDALKSAGEAAQSALDEAKEKATAPSDPAPDAAPEAAPAPAPEAPEAAPAPAPAEPAPQP